MGTPVLHVSLLAVPDAAVSTLTGLFDVMRSAGAAFDTQIVGEAAGALPLASGVPIEVQRSIDEVDACDIVIASSMWLRAPGWQKGRYPAVVSWLQRMHERGAMLCSACSGVFLLAETGLFDGKDATVHFDYADWLKAAYPSNTWHDLALYLIARHAGATEAQRVARAFALQWHQDGLTPFMTFGGKLDHGDAEVLAAQRWLQGHFSVASPVDEMTRRSKLSESTFKRRFVAATGLTPLEYVQRLRVEDAKRRLERTEDPVDDIAWRVGYEDPAFFRRLFRRVVGLTPGAYRKRFSIPDFARA
jgi:transcriptional regulator GlxA family with amidase domain